MSDAAAKVIAEKVVFEWAAPVVMELTDEQIGVLVAHYRPTPQNPACECAGSSVCPAHMLCAIIDQLRTRIALSRPQGMSREAIARALYKSRGQFDDTTCSLHFDWFHDKGHLTPTDRLRIEILYCYRDADAILSLPSVQEHQESATGAHIPEATSIAAWKAIAEERERTNEALHRELDDMTERCRTAEHRVRAALAASPPPTPDRDHESAGQEGWRPIETAILAEREACAELVEAKGRHYEGALCREIALEIRCRLLPAAPQPPLAQDEGP